MSALPLLARPWLPKLSVVGVLQADATVRTLPGQRVHLALQLVQPGGVPLHASITLPEADPQIAQAGQAYAGHAVLVIGRGLCVDGAGHVHLQHLQRWALVDGREFRTDAEIEADQRAAQAAAAAAQTEPELDLAAPTAA